MSVTYNSLRIEFFGKVVGFDIDDMPHFIEDFFKVNNITKEVDLYFVIVDAENTLEIEDVCKKFSLTPQQVTNPKNTLFHYFPNGERVSTSLRCIPVMGC